MGEPSDGQASLVSRRMNEAIARIRPRFALVRWVIDRLERARTFGLAAEMAFWLFLSLVPLAAVLGMVVAKLAVRNSGVMLVTVSALPVETRDLIIDELGKVSAWNGGAVAPFAAITFVWLASSGIHAVFDGVELQLESPPRPWWRKRVSALLSCVILSVAVACGTVLGTGLDWVRHFSEGAVHSTSSQSQAFGFLEGAVRAMLGAVLAVALNVALYRAAIPRSARKAMPLLPGATISVVLQVLVGLGYRAFLRRMGTGSAYSASLSVIAVTLTALYLSSLVLLLGAEFNQILLEVRKGPRPWLTLPPPSPDPDATES